jgi:LmbE family N-acetylglucosaminyl deacetylase
MQLAFGGVTNLVMTKVEGKRILAVGAHPDDVEFMCGGTLALLRQKGFDINIATVCSGNKGSAELGPEAIAQKRFKEATESAKVLGATFTSLGEPDLELVFSNRVRYKAAELVRRINPLIVITHSPEDYMPDHEITSDLLWDACFNASVVNYVTNQPNPAEPTKSVPFLFYADASGSVDRFGTRVPVDFYVDISSVMEKKKEMLSKHESQRSWLKKQHGIDDYIEKMLAWDGRRGEKAGVQFAEAFRQHRGTPFPTENPLSEILPQVISSPHFWKPSLCSKRFSKIYPQD